MRIIRSGPDAQGAGECHLVPPGARAGDMELHRFVKHLPMLHAQPAGGVFAIWVTPEGVHSRQHLV
jgi:hypothetical protein